MRFVYKVGIVSCLLGFFVMSHNASAASLSYNLNDYDWITSVNLGTQYCAYSYNNFGSSPSICLLNRTNPNMYGIRSYDIPHEKGDIGEFYIGFQNNIRGSYIGYNYGFFMDNFGTINDNYKIISVEKVIDTVYYNSVSGSTIICDTSDTHFLECSQSADPAGGGPYEDNLYSNVYKITILFTTKGSHPIGLSALNANTPIGTCKIGDGLGTNPGAQCQVRIFGFTQWGYKGSSVNKEQADATQEAADESESEAQDNSSNAQTTNLIGAFQSFVNSLSSLNATNCNVTLPFPSNLGGSMQVNICQNKDYAGNIVSVFGSLTLIVFYIPFSLKLLSMIYNEIRSFTNG